MKLYAIPLTVFVHCENIRDVRELAEYIVNSVSCDTNSNCLFKALHDIELDDCYQLDIDEAEE
jgi:hypothetical protein